MFNKTVSKYNLLLTATFLAACVSTDPTITADSADGKTSVSTEGQADARGYSGVLPSLDEAQKKRAASEPESAKEQKPETEAEKADRIAVVKEIMKSKKATQLTYEQKQRGENPNAFYRFKREKAETKRLIDDGVHDPTADLHDLQPPIEALKPLPESTFGNGVNWVDALNKHKINPRADQVGKMQQFTLDMNISMEVPGTMNDVLFPHVAHTAWLSCSNCHTEIFQMKRGGNPITMKKINNGEYCGVCHGKVAFPIADCNRCHSVSKQAKITAN